MKVNIYEVKYIKRPAGFVVIKNGHIVGGLFERETEAINFIIEKTGGK